jgi:hypothetical protein
MRLSKKSRFALLGIIFSKKSNASAGSATTQCSYYYAIFSTQRSQRLSGADILRAILILPVPMPLVSLCFKL